MRGARGLTRRGGFVSSAERSDLDVDGRKFASSVCNCPGAAGCSYERTQRWRRSISYSRNHSALPNARRSAPASSPPATPGPSPSSPPAPSHSSRSSRTKKITCRPSKSANETCYACQTAGVICRYKERDRIRAERGIADFTVAPSEGPSLARSVGPSEASSRSTSRRGSNASTASTASIQPPPEAVRATASAANDQQRIKLLVHFITLFFDYGGTCFPFLDSRETVSRASSSGLSPLMACCITAYAAR